MLVIFSFAVQAHANVPLTTSHGDPRFQLAPYIADLIPYIAMSNRLTEYDKQFCARRARIAAGAHEFALGGGSQDIQLKAWDAFSISQSAKGIKIKELQMLRDVISYAWFALEQYPTVTSNQYGDYVYAACLEERANKPVPF